MYTCMCNWVTLLYSRKLTEHYKPAAMEKIKIIIKQEMITTIILVDTQPYTLNRIFSPVMTTFKLYSATFK